MEFFCWRTRVGASLVPLVASMVFASALGGCASLPAKEASALRTLAEADVSAFDNAVQADASARVAQAQSFLADGDGRVVVSAGCGTESTESCAVTYTLTGGGSRALRSAAPNSRALLGSIKRYAEQMATLAEAKDLETMKAKAEAAAGSLKALALLISPATAWADPLIHAANFVGIAQKREARRRALLRVAEAAQPWIKVAADDLQRVWDNLRVNARDGATFRIYDLDERVKSSGEEVRRLRVESSAGRLSPATSLRIEELQARQSADLAELVTASATLNSMRDEQLSFRKLTEAHDELIASLKNPKANTEDIVRDAGSVLALLEKIKVSTGTKE